jgi:large subunit ribosomal protein L25
VSNQDIALLLQERTVQGKAVKQLRRDGLIPAVIHDHGKPSKIVMADNLELSKVYQLAGKHHALALKLGEEKYVALIKDIRFDPKKHQLQHVVFNAIKQDEKVQTEVPITLEGEVPAEKTGLIVINTLDHIEIEALPKDLIDSVTISAEGLVEIGDKVTVADLRVPEGVTILTELEHTIAIVEEPRAHVEEEAEEIEGEEGEEIEGEEGETEGGEDSDDQAEASNKQG